MTQRAKTESVVCQMTEANEPTPQYRVVLKLPFSVMLVNKTKFESLEDAQTLIEQSYPQFPAFEVATQDDVDDWKGTTYMIETPKTTTMLWMLDVKSGTVGDTRSHAIAASLTDGRERFKRRFGAYPGSVFIRSEDLPTKTATKDDQPAVNHWPDWLKPEMIRPFRMTPLHCTFAANDVEFLGDEEDEEPDAEASSSAA